MLVTGAVGDFPNGGYLDEISCEPGSSKVPPGVPRKDRVSGIFINTSRNYGVKLVKALPAVFEKHPSLNFLVYKLENKINIATATIISTSDT